MNEFLRRQFPDASGGIAPRTPDPSVNVVKNEEGKLFLVAGEIKRPLVVSDVAVVSIADEEGNFYLVEREKDHPFAPGKLDLNGQGNHVSPHITINGLFSHIGMEEIELDPELLGEHERVQFYPGRGNDGLGEYRHTKRKFLTAKITRDQGDALIELGGFRRFSLEQLKSLPPDAFRREEVLAAMIYHRLVLDRRAFPGFHWYDPYLIDPNPVDPVAAKYLREAIRTINL